MLELLRCLCPSLFTVYDALYAVYTMDVYTASVQSAYLSDYVCYQLNFKIT